MKPRKEGISWRREGSAFGCSQAEQMSWELTLHLAAWWPLGRFEWVEGVEAWLRCVGERGIGKKRTLRRSRCGVAARGGKRG